MSQKKLMKVCAIVVTHNRKELLARLLAKLLEGSQLLQKIYVIDNASTDKSYEYLCQTGLLTDQKIEWVRLHENEGGAGGFYQGLELARSNGFEYSWLMDDDGYPLSGCLDCLLQYAGPNCVVGPVVIDDSKNQNANLSFSFRLPKSLKVISTYEDYLKRFPTKCENTLFPFNGTLIPISLISKIGLPRREYFIWGDETEYVYRLKKYSYNIYTISSALFFHPRVIKSSVPMFFGLLKYNDPNSPLKLYCFVRNTLKTLFEYRSSFHALLFLLKVLWFNLFTKFNSEKLLIIISAVRDSIKDDFSKHRNYL